MIVPPLYKLVGTDTWIDVGEVVAVMARLGDPLVSRDVRERFPIGPDLSRTRLTISFRSGKEFTVYYDLLDDARVAAADIARKVAGE
jgi:hypothetical protein